MCKVQKGWRWEEGKVDRRKEYLELSYLDLNVHPWGEQIPLARVAKPKRQVFKVEWLVRADSAEMGVCWRRCGASSTFTWSSWATRTRGRMRNTTAAQRRIFVRACTGCIIRERGR